jgi:Ca2+-binding EF-hand superfamily protein
MYRIIINRSILFLSIIFLIFSISKINGDGKIDKSELVRLYEAIHELKGKDTGKCSDHAEEDVGKILAKHDLDGDGSLNKAEFVQALGAHDLYSFFK